MLCNNLLLMKGIRQYLLVVKQYKAVQHTKLV